MQKALYIMSEDIFNLVYGETKCAEIESLVDIYAPCLDSSLLAQNPDILGTDGSYDHKLGCSCYGCIISGEYT